MKKIKFFVVLMCVISLMFGTTLCYAEEAESEAVTEESVERSVTGTSVVRKITIPFYDTGIQLFLEFDILLDEGYTACFQNARLAGVSVPENFPHKVTILISGHNADGNSSYVTVSFWHLFGTEKDPVEEGYSQAVFYVDEYGNIS